MIPRETIDRIYAAAKIEDVIGDYMTLRRRGANLWGNCPFHDEKTPSFSVSPSKGIYKCFGCGKAGNVVNFIMETEQCSYTDALRTLAKKYHIEVKEKEMTDEERQRENERESLFKMNEWANSWFQNQLWNTEEGQNIGFRYFIERGLREDIIRKFQLGYSPNKNVLYYDAIKAGYSEEFLLKTGLCGVSQYTNEGTERKSDPHYDRFRDRVIFPIFTISGKVVAFAGRILKKKEHTGKYVNSPDSAIYSKQNELYGLFQAKQSISKQQMCYLVEGQMDVISMHMAGIENVVSSGGTALTKRQVHLMHRLTENVTILYDGDSAGIHAALRGIDMLLEEGLNLKVVLLPDGEDPDSMARKMNAVDFQQFLKDNAQDFIHFKTNLLLQDAGNDPIRRSAVIKDLVNSISLIPDLITRQVYIKDCASLLGMREEALLKETNRNRREHYSNKNTAEQPAAESKQNTQSDSPADNPAEDIQPQKPVTDTPSETPAPATQPASALSRLDIAICNLLQILVRYGNYPFYDTTVGEYILTELDQDNITFENPLFEKLLTEYREHYTEEGFVSETFFKFHPNSYISSLAISLISKDYDLSRIWGKEVKLIGNTDATKKSVIQMPSDADRLPSLVPRLVLDLKQEINRQEQLANTYALQHAQENGENVMPFIEKSIKLKEIELAIRNAKKLL